MPKIYVASSWRNEYQQRIVELCRLSGFEVYDFRNPYPGNTGFKWSDIDPDWKNWTPEKYRYHLKDRIAIEGFNADMKALKECDICLLVMPAGRSSHLELGYASGTRKITACLYLDNSGFEPELMNRMLAYILVGIDDLKQWLRDIKLEFEGKVL